MFHDRDPFCFQKQEGFSWPRATTSSPQTSIAVTGVIRKIAVAFASVKRAVNSRALKRRVKGAAIRRRLLITHPMSVLFSPPNAAAALLSSAGYG
jgi:hypothetical protein